VNCAVAVIDVVADARVVFDDAILGIIVVYVAVGDMVAVVGDHTGWRNVQDVFDGLGHWLHYRQHKSCRRRGGAKGKQLRMVLVVVGVDVDVDVVGVAVADLLELH